MYENESFKFAALHRLKVMFVQLMKFKAFSQFSQQLMLNNLQTTKPTYSPCLNSAPKYGVHCTVYTAF